MNRTIKFRGESMGSDFVYGLLSQKVIRHSGRISWSIATGLKQSENIPVIEETIAQLVGYDKNGNEVYEGDTLVRDDGSETVVDYRDNPDYVHLHTLKEQSS